MLSLLPVVLTAAAACYDSMADRGKRRVVQNTLLLLA